MPIVVLSIHVTSQAHPLAFLEFIKTKSGGTERRGPRNETEELQIHEQWKVGLFVDFSDSSSLSNLETT